MLVKRKFLAKHPDNPRRKCEFEILIPRHELGMINGGTQGSICKTID